MPLKAANLDFDDNSRTNLKPALEVILSLLFRWKTLKIGFEIGELWLFMLNLLTDSGAN